MHNFFFISALQDLQSSSHNEIEQLALSYSSCPLNSSLPKHSLNCHALVVDNVTCMRVNTIPLYMEANRMVSICAIPLNNCDYIT